MTNEQIIRSIRAGNADAISILIQTNIGLARRIARRYLDFAQRTRSADMEDLVQAGIVGILEAAKTYDETKGMSFASFAFMYIRSSINNLLGLYRNRIENTILASLSETVNDDEDIELIETIADNKAIDPEETAVKRDLMAIMEEAIACLPDEQREAIIGKYFSDPPQAAGRAGLLGLQTLRSNQNIMALWYDYQAPLYWYSSIQAFNTTWTSPVERAAEAREGLRRRLTNAIK